MMRRPTGPRHGCNGCDGAMQPLGDRREGLRPAAARRRRFAAPTAATYAPRLAADGDHFPSPGRRAASKAVARAPALQAEWARWQTAIAATNEDRSAARRAKDLQRASRRAARLAGRAWRPARPLRLKLRARDGFIHPDH